MTHAGRPIIRYHSDRIVVLCPLGHLIHSQSKKDWAGGWLEAKVSDRSWRVTCDGFTN